MRPERLDEQLAALDRAIELDPRGTDTYDLKATVLAEAGHFEAALSACHPPVFGDRAPLQLRGRAAWILSLQGDLPTGVERMKAIVQEDPLYAWGWYNLMLWHDKANERAECVAAAEALARTSPRDASAHNYLGIAKTMAGDRTGAKQAFRRVLDLDPKHAPAFHSLMDLHLSDNDVDEAARIIDLIEPFLDRPTVLSQRVMLAAQTGDQATACATLKSLCAEQVDDPTPLHAAVAAMTARRWQRVARTTLEAAFADETVTPHTAAAWAVLCMEAREWKRVRKGLYQLRDWPRHWNRACLVFLERLDTILLRSNGRLSRWRYFRQIRKLLQECPAQITEDTELWALVGRALMIGTKYKKACAFQADWRERADLKPWQLINLAYSLATLGRDDERIAVCRHALTLPPDHTTPLHQMWLALEDVCDDNCAAASRRMQNVSAPGDLEFYLALHAMIGAMIAVDRAAREWRPIGILASPPCLSK